MNWGCVPGRNRGREVAILLTLPRDSRGKEHVAAIGVEVRCYDASELLLVGWLSGCSWWFPNLGVPYLLFRGSILGSPIFVNPQFS